MGAALKRMGRQAGKRLLTHSPRIRIGEAARGSSSDDGQRGRRQVGHSAPLTKNVFFQCGIGGATYPTRLMNSPTPSPNPWEGAAQL